MILAAELAHPGSGASVLLLLITALVVTASWTVRADRARVAAVRDKGAADERLRLARELHDVVGHGLGVVAIQTSNARLALQRGDSAKASTAISLAEASSRTAMREMRQMLGVLTEAPDGQPVVSLPGIADIGELVQGVRDTGTPVDWVSAGSWEHVPAAVQLCAFRVVQEGLTNVMKHAPGSHVVVEVGIRGGQLVATRDQQRVRQQAGRIRGWLGPGRAACPRRRPRGATDRWSEGDWMGSRSRPPILSRSAMSIRVGICDDQALIRDGLQVQLGMADDIEVVGTAADGEQAVALARRERPDVLLMDIRMPVLDGITATRRISDDPTCAGVRTIILTTFDIDEHVYGALAAGASGFLLKDASPEEIVRAIRVVAAGDALLAPAVTARLISRFARLAPGSGREPGRSADRTRA